MVQDYKNNYHLVEYIAHWVHPQWPTQEKEAIEAKVGVVQVLHSAFDDIRGVGFSLLLGNGGSFCSLAGLQCHSPGLEGLECLITVLALAFTDNMNG